MDHADLLERTLHILEEADAHYCVIGGQAVNAYAEPLVSLDLDVVIAAEGLHHQQEQVENGLATVLRILEAKGYVTHEKAGRAFTYRPLVDQTQAQRRALSHLVSGLFNNSPSLLVLNVLADDRIDARELSRLKQLIRDSK